MKPERLGNFHLVISSIRTRQSVGARERRSQEANPFCRKGRKEGKKERKEVRKERRKRKKEGQKERKEKKKERKERRGRDGMEEGNG